MIHLHTDKDPRINYLKDFFSTYLFLVSLCHRCTLQLLLFHPEDTTTRRSESRVRDFGLYINNCSNKWQMHWGRNGNLLEITRNFIGGWLVNIAHCFWHLKSRKNSASGQWEGKVSLSYDKRLQKAGALSGLCLVVTSWPVCLKSFETRGR